MGKNQGIFSSTATKVVAWIVLALAAIVLILGGTTVEELSKDIVLVAGIVTAVAALVAFIAERVKK